MREVRNVSIQIGYQVYLVDFLVLDISVDKELPLLLGRPFLRSCGAVIDMGRGTMSIDDGVICHTYFPKPRAKAYLENFERIDEDGFIFVFLSLGWHLEEIHVTWAQFGKKRDKIATLHDEGLKNLLQTVETASEFHAMPSGHQSDGVKILAMALKHSRHKETLEDLASQDKDDYSTCVRIYLFFVYLFVNVSFLTMLDEITLESLIEEQFECFIEYYRKNYLKDYKSNLENLKEVYKMMNGGVEYPLTQNASPSEIKEPYEPSPKMYSYEQPSCLGSTSVSETLRKSDQMHQTFEKSSMEITHKFDDMIELPKS
ncbi:retrovirus-related pol polyprotein from transposon TNT 1-94 [Tanacetum coccineum]